MNNYYFTFGHGQMDGPRHLFGFYTIIEAESETAAREIMVERRCQSWCTSYATPEDAGVDRFNLALIQFDQLEVWPRV